MAAFSFHFVHVFNMGGVRAGLCNDDAVQIHQLISGGDGTISMDLKSRYSRKTMGFV